MIWVQSVYLIIGLGVGFILVIGLAAAIGQHLARRSDDSIRMACRLCNNLVSEWVSLAWQTERSHGGSISMTDHTGIVTLCRPCTSLVVDEIDDATAAVILAAEQKA